MKKSFLAAILVGLASALGCGAGPGINGIPLGSGSNSNASLTGSYVYHLSGIDDNSGASYEESGVFVADGKGNITGGVDDATEQGVGTSLGNSISGTYSISSNGTGTLTLNGSAFQSSNLEVTVASSSTVYLVEADALNASGTAELQNSSAASAAPTGTFAFRMHTTSAQGSVGTVGQFTVSAGIFQSGSVDVNQSGTASSPTLTNFTFNAPIANGRGTGSFSDSAGVTSAFNYYIVDSNNIRLLATDSTANIGGHGRAEMQTGGPFSASSFSGSYAFAAKGDDNSGTDSVNTVGQFTASAGTITSGTFDSVEDGTPLSNVPITAGTYQVASNGRVTASFTSSSGTVNKVFWLVSPSQAFFVTASNPTDSSLVEDGTANLQQTTAFSTSSINGQFAFMMDGFNPAALVDRVGTLQWDGAGNLKLNELVNDSGVTSTPGVLTGTYSVGTNGRVAGSITNLSVNPNDLVFYMISNTDGYVLQDDSGTELIGRISQQH